MTRLTFTHPINREDITDQNYQDIANDLFYLQSEEVIRVLQEMIAHEHWGDDDTDYMTTMRDAHGILQDIAYDGSKQDLIHFLFSYDPTGDYEGYSPEVHIMCLNQINSAGGLCSALETYIVKDW